MCIDGVVLCCPCFLLDNLILSRVIVWLLCVNWSQQIENSRNFVLTRTYLRNDYFVEMNWLEQLGMILMVQDIKG